MFLSAESLKTWKKAIQFLGQDERRMEEFESLRAGINIILIFNFIVKLSWQRHKLCPEKSSILGMGSHTELQRGKLSITV